MYRNAKIHSVYPGDGDTRPYAALVQKSEAGASRWMLGTLGAFFVLNFLDACATAVALQAGAAEELNPAMRAIAETNLGSFVVVKVLAGLCTVGVFWAGRHTVVGRVGVLCVTAIYGAVALHHAIEGRAFWLSF